jgi:hypothetical protein
MISSFDKRFAEIDLIELKELRVVMDNAVNAENKTAVKIFFFMISILVFKLTINL